MSAEALDEVWYEKFFSGAALDLWRRAIAPEHTEQEVQFLHDVLEARSEASLLDVPCGNGRLSMPLSQMGYRMTALDSCIEFLEEGIKVTKEFANPIDFVSKDMRHLPYSEEFDGAFCMGNSFGYFDRKGTKQFLAGVAAALKPDANFVLDSSMVAECFLVNGGEKEWLSLGDMYMLIENKYDCKRGVVETDYTFIQNGKEEKRKALHWIYTASDVVQLLEQNGMTVVGMYGSADFEPFTLGSERLLLVSKKTD